MRYVNRHMDSGIGGLRVFLKCIWPTLLLFTISCSTIPRLEPVTLSGIPAVRKSCGLPFPRGDWQFIHSIEAAMPGGIRVSLIGVIDISPEVETIRCIIMSIEGLVLFDGAYEGEVVVNRGIQPFDSKEFAEGLMNDIRLIFFRPSGEPVDMGVLRSGSYVCRYRDDGESILDVIVAPDRSWGIRRYRDGILNRSVNAYLDEGAVEGVRKDFPARMELSASGHRGYSLTLKLIRAEPLN